MQKFRGVRAGQALSGSEHFFAVMRRGMQQILIDYSRGRNAVKRQLPADFEMASPAGNFEPPIDLTAAVSRLEQLDVRAYNILRYRSDYGMTWDQIAEKTGTNPKQAREDYQFAIHWLRTELAG